MYRRKIQNNFLQTKNYLENIYFHKRSQLSVIRLGAGDTRATTYNAIIKTVVNMRQILLANIITSGGV
jgi:hypothetical protein